MEKLKITYLDKNYEIPTFSTPQQMIDSYKLKVENPVGAIINGHLTRLNKRIKVDSTIEFIDRKTNQGQRIYESSLVLLFLAAYKRLFPDYNVFIQHSINQGLYAETKEHEPTEKEIAQIEEEMNKMVKEEIPIARNSDDWEVYISRMEKQKRTDMIKLLRYYPYTLIKTYTLDQVEENLYLPVLPNTKLIHYFKLIKYKDGIGILYPNFYKTKKINKFCDYPKLFKTYREYHEWSRILKIRTVGQLNRYIMEDDISSLVKTTEALHEKKVSKIADEITSKDFTPRLILIAGPSSSGKTTFSKRLDIQLRVNGILPVAISLDDYFVEREKTPKDANGNYDFESLRAIDVALFTQHLQNLLDGKEIEIPKFDFRTGKRKPTGKKLTLKENQLVIIEGIHGLNPKLTEPIADKHKFKIFVSALTQLNLHRHDRVPTSDTRLLRRIVRDGRFRGYSASETLLQWRSVRAGEETNIFPFQEQADIIFNSALFYELSVLKGFAERELLKVERSHPMYAEARRLLKFLSYFLPLKPDQVPNTSILKEFIGGSSFGYS